MRCESNGCPTVSEMESLCQGGLPENQEMALIARVEACDACAKVLEDMGGLFEVSKTEWQEISRDCQSERLKNVVDQWKQPSQLRGARAQSVLDSLAAWIEPSEGSLGKVGRYRLIGCVGRGGMGVVFRAFDEALGRDVAVKCMSPGLLVNPDNAIRFQREARAVAAISHESVIAIHAVSSIRELPYLVMEFVDGGSLQQRLENDEHFDHQARIEIASQIASGLSAAHEKGIVHRDIKPANLLIDRRRNRVRITDFGLAMSETDLAITKTGTLLGTPHYLAPEQLDGEKVDHRCDLFSLGCVLFRLTTGRPAFEGEAIWDVVNSVLHQDPPSIASMNTDAPEWFSGLVAQLLEKDPNRRPATADEVVEALTERRESKHWSVSHREVPRLEIQNNTPKKTSKWYSSMFGAMVCGAIVFGGLLFVMFAVVNKRAFRNPAAADVQAMDSETLSRLLGGNGTELVVELKQEGPYFIDPIKLRNQSLKLSAADDVKTAILVVDCRADEPAFQCNRGRLELEGIEIRVSDRVRGLENDSSPAGWGFTPVIVAEASEVELVRCQVSNLGRPILSANESAVVINRCLLETGEHAITFAGSNGRRMLIESSQVNGETGIRFESETRAEISLIESEFRCIHALHAQAMPTNERVTIRSRGTIYDCTSAVLNLVDFRRSQSEASNDLPTRIFPRWESDGRIDQGTFIQILDERNEFVQSVSWDQFVELLSR